MLRNTVIITEKLLANQDLNTEIGAIYNDLTKGKTVSLGMLRSVCKSLTSKVVENKVN